MEEQLPFEVEELADEPYSLDGLADRWRQEAASGRIDAKQWAAAHFSDVRFAALASPEDSTASLLAMKAGVVLLASRADRGSIPFELRGDQVESVENNRERLPLGAIQERLRAAYGTLRHGGASLDSLFLPYDSDSVFDALISARVAFQALELEQYAASAECSWLAILALTGSFGSAELSADFVRTPEIAHAEFVQINATSPSLQISLERCVAYMRERMREKLPSELSMGQAAQFAILHLQSILRRGSAGSLELDVEDVFAFWGLIGALQEKDAVRTFAELAALLSAGAGSRFDERGAPLRSAARRRPSGPVHPAAPIVASMVREWTAHGDLPRKLLSGKHLPPGATERDVHARLLFAPKPWTTYLQRRIMALDEDRVLEEAANELRQPFLSAVLEGRAAESAAHLRLVDSPEQIGAAGAAIVFLLQDESETKSRASALAGLLAAPPPSPSPPPSSSEPIGVTSPYGSYNFIGPATAVDAHPVPRDKANFMLQHWKGGKDEPITAVAVKAHLLDVMGRATVPRESFERRGGWFLSRTSGSVEVATSSETGPVLLRGACVGIVRVVNVVRTDKAPAKKQARVPVQGMSGSRWFAGIDAAKASELRDLFSPSTRLMRLYKDKAEQMLGNNRTAAFSTAEQDDAALREQAMAIFGTTKGSLTKKKRLAGAPPPLTLGARAGQKEDSLLIYGQLGLGRFFDSDGPEALVLQLVAFLPLAFRVHRGELEVFPFAMPEVKAVPPEWTSGRATPSDLPVVVQALDNGLELFFRMARLDSGERPPQIPVAAADQYAYWIRPLGGALQLDRLAITDGGSIPEALEFEQRHYVFLPDVQVYASQQTDSGALQVSFLYADAVRSLLSGKPHEPAPAPSSGYDFDAFAADVAGLFPPRHSQGDEDMSSDALRQPSLDPYPAEWIDAYYSNVAASAVLDLSEPEDSDDRPVLERIRSRLSALIASRSAPVFFGDARHSVYNEDSIMELGMPDYIFGERFFSEEYERAPPELVRRAFLEPLDALEAHHLRDSSHLEAVRTLRALLLYDEEDLRRELAETDFEGLEDFCEARGYVPHALETVQDMWKSARMPGAPLVSNGLLLRRFFLPSAYVEGRAMRSYFGWLSFTEATAAQYRFPKEGTAVLGLCGLYAVAEGLRRQRASL